MRLASGVLGKRMHLHDATLSVQHTERKRAAHHGRTEHDVRLDVRPILPFRLAARGA